MGPRGNAGQLTEHRPRWTGTHETVQSPPDTMQKRNKAQADTEASQGAGAARSALAQPERKGAKRGSVSWAPDLARDLVSESVSGSVSDSLTDIATAAHLDPTVPTGREPEAQRARKFSVDAPADGDTARPRKGSTGEPRSQTEILYHQQTRTLPSNAEYIFFSFKFFLFFTGFI